MNTAASNSAVALVRKPSPSVFMGSGLGPWGRPGMTC
jgi:hypothetical protein